jgi:hypothetical protein
MMFNFSHPSDDDSLVISFFQTYATTCNSYMKIFVVLCLRLGGRYDEHTRKVEEEDLFSISVPARRKPLV